MTPGSSVKPDDGLADPEEDEPAIARPVVDLGSAFSATPMRICEQETNNRLIMCHYHYRSENTIRGRVSV